MLYAIELLRFRYINSRIILYVALGVSWIDSKMTDNAVKGDSTDLDRRPNSFDEHACGGRVQLADHMSRLSLDAQSTEKGDIGDVNTKSNKAKITVILTKLSSR